MASYSIVSSEVNIMSVNNAAVMVLAVKTEIMILSQTIKKIILIFTRTLVILIAAGL